MATRDSMIQVTDLKKHYNMGAIKALDGITVDICQGDVIAVIGPSGSGKSTFLRSLNLLEEPTSGSIIFNGIDITKKKYKDAQGKTQKLNIDHLLKRIKEGKIEEVILALNVTIDGETTALYLQNLLKDFPVKVTRLACGLSMGSSLDYIDPLTLRRAFEGRK